MFIAILLAPVFGMIGAAMARSRNRNAIAWGIACFITGIFGIITLLLVGTDPSLAARIPTPDMKRWNTLLEVDADIAAAAAKVGAGVLVAGAFGHPRLQEFIFGGTTRTLLNADRPSLFLSH